MGAIYTETRLIPCAEPPTHKPAPVVRMSLPISLRRSTVSQFADLDVRAAEVVGWPGTEGSLRAVAWYYGRKHGIDSPVISVRKHDGRLYLINNTIPVGGD